MLLHACTHSAYDFFAPGPACPACVGLCEEARVADAFADAGFDVAAVSSRDRRSGCWADGDAAAARAVVAAWRGRAGAPDGAAIVAFGASSGGWFAEVLGAAGVAAAAFSQVAPQHKAGGHHLLALTSMPRDARGHGRARAFFDAFPPDRRAPFAECAPRAVDAPYLGDRLGVAPAALEGAVAGSLPGHRGQGGVHLGQVHLIVTYEARPGRFRIAASRGIRLAIALETWGRWGLAGLVDVVATRGA